MRLVKGMIEGVVFIQDPRNKREVMEILRKHLRLSTDQDAETSYNSLCARCRVSMSHPTRRPGETSKSMLHESLPKSRSWISIRLSM